MSKNQKKMVVMLDYIKVSRNGLLKPWETPSKVGKKSEVYFKVGNKIK